MNALEVLLLTGAAGLVLERRGEKLVVLGSGPNTPPQLLELLREHKPTLLRVVTDRSTSPSARE